MDKINSKMKKKIILIGFLLITLMSCEKQKKLMEEIYGEPGYTIGKATYSVNVLFNTVIHYEYTVGSTSYKGKKKSVGIGQTTDFTIGRQFLVVYKQSDPNKSDMNFNYPINTEQDFWDLLDRFKTDPSKP
jgi:hypothetical protein